MVQHNYFKELLEYEISQIESIMNCTPQLLKGQPEDGLAVCPKHVAEL